MTRSTGGSQTVGTGTKATPPAKTTGQQKGDEAEFFSDSIASAVQKGAAPTYPSTSTLIDQETGEVLLGAAPLPQFLLAVKSGCEPVIPDDMDDLVGELPDPVELPEGVVVARNRKTGETLELGGGGGGGKSGSKKK